MAPIETLHQRLVLVASLLDTAAAEVRDVPVNPARDNIRHIGDALASIHEVLRSIYVVRPDLRPEALDQPSSDADANKRLTPVLAEAYRLLDKGQVPQAIEMLASYAATETSPLHRSIALSEIEAFRREGDT
jgi:hypothetical protein